jgi:hypothetical protein
VSITGQTRVSQLLTHWQALARQHPAGQPEHGPVHWQRRRCGEHFQWHRKAVARPPGPLGESLAFKRSSKHNHISRYTSTAIQVDSESVPVPVTAALPASGEDGARVGESSSSN